MRLRRVIQAAAVVGTISAAVIPEGRYPGQNLLNAQPPSEQPEAEADSTLFLRLPIGDLFSGAKSLFEDILKNSGGEKTGCYCSGGVICCEEAEGPRCNYGTCGI